MFPCSQVCAGVRLSLFVLQKTRGRDAHAKYAPRVARAFEEQVLQSPLAHCSRLASNAQVEYKFIE